LKLKIKVQKPTKEQIEEAKEWPLWSCDVSEFEWHYDTKETCLILEGEVEIKTDDGSVKFKEGDYVIFPEGLSCKWRVLKAVKKHYKFN
jgi:uncharacterized cupin superfamily protein